MAKAKKDSLRYFTRHKSAMGHLRAVIRSGGVRKYILTPFVVTNEQMERFDRSGHIRVQTIEDMKLETRLREFTQCVWEEVSRLVTAGRFDLYPATYLTTDIINRYKEKQSQRQERAAARAEADFQRKAEEAEAKGNELAPLSPGEFKALREKLKSVLAPEEYAALWEKGGNDGE